MTGFIHIVLIVLWGLCVPFILGMLIDRMLADSTCILCARNLAFGFMLMAAVFELLAVPMILLKMPFHILKNSWIAVVLCLVLCSLSINYKGFSEKLKNGLNDIRLDRLTVFIWIAVVFLVLFQTYLLAGQMHVDTDDSRFVAEALEAVERDTMLSYHPITGRLVSVPVGEMNKDVMSPYPIFLGLFAELFQLPPAVTAHVILPVLFIPLCYVVYSVIGSFFFDGDKKYIGLFLLFLSMIHLFSFESIYASGYTLLTIIWQGRSVAAMIMLPMLWYVLLRMTGRERLKRRDYLLFVTAMLSCAMMSTMGSMLSLLLAGVYICVFAFQKKSLKTVFWLGLCMCPNVICVVMSKLLISSDYWYGL